MENMKTFTTKTVPSNTYCVSVTLYAKTKSNLNHHLFEEPFPPKKKARDTMHGERSPACELISPLRPKYRALICGQSFVQRIRLDAL